MTPQPPAPVLIVGSIAFDDLELPTATAHNVIGGAAIYASLAATLFAPVRIVAVIGDDFPDEMLRDLRQRGVDTTGVVRAPGQTFRWSGRYSQDLSSRTTLSTQLNVFADFRPALPEPYRDSSFVLLANIHPALQLQVLDQAVFARFVATDTMNFWIEGERSLLESVLARTDTLVINDEELRQLAERHNLKRAAAAVLKRGPQRLVVKRGEHGAMLFDSHGMFFVPAYPLDDEVDPTGAGDTFAGALVGTLAAAGDLSGTTLRQALLNAATVASFCVEDVGTQRLTRLTRDDIARRLDSLRSLVRIE
jgi:sugar/nucleoside kinase (ribokinase family)